MGGRFHLNCDWKSLILEPLCYSVSTMICRQAAIYFFFMSFVFTAPNEKTEIKTKLKIKSVPMQKKNTRMFTEFTTLIQNQNPLFINKLLKQF